MKTIEVTDEFYSTLKAMMKFKYEGSCTHVLKCMINDNGNYSFKVHINIKKHDRMKNHFRTL